MDAGQIDREVLLLDMGGTFMFGCDRFSSPHQLASTYLELGGGRLSERDVAGAISQVIARMEPLYASEAHYESFPSVRDVLPECHVETPLDPEDVDILTEVFARHEVGTIPDSHRAILKELAGSYRLGVVSNVWGSSSVFRAAFDAAGVSDLFEVTVFSSDYGCIKPSPRIFRRALAAMNVDPLQAAFVGDDLRCDISGAKRAGMAAVWISPGDVPATAHPAPDLVIRDLGNGELGIDQRKVGGSAPGPTSQSGRLDVEQRHGRRRGICA